MKKTIIFSFIIIANFAIARNSANTLSNFSSIKVTTIDIGGQNGQLPIPTPPKP